MNGESLNIIQDRLEKLKTDFPEIFTEGKIDIEKFKATFSDDINLSNERYVLNWAGKSDAFKVLQIPTTATLKPQLDESVNFDSTGHIFIEGENLEVLKVLQKSYYGKIKCIIIDPPYNTGSDSFIYPDKFKENKSDYERRIGDKDEEGYLMKEGMFRKNSKDSGHFHSNWLSMMYPRLFLAKNLLKDDGVIFVHIDDNEVHNLRLIMNEIFGEENFIAQIIWQKVFSPKNTAQFFSEDHEYIITYAKNKEVWRPELIERGEESKARYTNPDNDPRGPWLSGALQARNYYSKGQYEVESKSGKKFSNPKGTYWRFSKERFVALDRDNRIWWGENNDNVPRLKRFLSEVKSGIVPQTFWGYKEVGHTQEAKEELKKYVSFENDENVFNTVKPIRLIKKILEIGTKKNEGDIVLDFFSGSGSCGQAVLQKNLEDSGDRKFILVQLQEPLTIPEKNVETIADLTKSRLRNFISLETAKTNIFKSEDLGFKTFKLTPSNFKVWRSAEINEENLVQQLEAFTNPVHTNSSEQNMVYELMLKAGYLLTDKVEKLECFYSIKNGELLIAVESINQATVSQMISLHPKKIITLDILFKNNDQLKTNTVLQMKDAGIDFKTI